MKYRPRQRPLFIGYRLATMIIAGIVGGVVGQHASSAHAGVIAAAVAGVVVAAMGILWGNRRRS